MTMPAETQLDALVENHRVFLRYLERRVGSRVRVFRAREALRNG